MSKNVSHLRWPLAAALWGTVVAIGGGTALAQAPEPTIAVAPTSDLEAGHVVTVEGSGWNPGDSVGVAQCAEGFANLRQDCVNDTAQLTAAGSDGTFTAELTISVGAMGPGGKTCDAGSTCLVAARVLGQTTSAQQTVTLAAAAEAPATSASPSADAADSADESADDETAADETDDDGGNTGLVVVIVVVILAVGAAVLLFLRSRSARA
jgi:hypothetical protein